MSTPIQNLFNLEGKTALVTGGSRGLGLQIAEALGEAGAKIMLTARKADELESAMAHLQDRGIDTRWVAGDMSFWLVSDLEMNELASLEALLRKPG